MTIQVYHVGYKLELNLMNITALNGRGTFTRSDLSIYTGGETNYIVMLRESYTGYSEGAAILFNHYIRRHMFVN